MSKFVVAVFPGENQAYEGTRALNALHAEGHLTLYSMAVVAKDGKGNVSTKDAADAGPLGTAVGARAVHAAVPAAEAAAWAPVPTARLPASAR